MKCPRLAHLALPILAAAGGASTAQSTLNGPLWSAEGNQAGAGFASSVAAAGDVNGDGYGDILVGAYSFDGDLNDEGSASLYLGSPEGPSKLADWSVRGGQQSANLGNSVAAAGDVNGDGFDDVIVGANGHDNHIGRAYVYLGSQAGLVASPAWFAQPGDYEFGWSVASAGDVNGDGFDDVIVGAIGFTNDQLYEGRVHVYHGSAAGLHLAPAWIVEGNQASSWFGGWVSSAGDVNGDGFDDVIVGAPRWNNGQNDEGRAFAYLGSAAGLATTPAWVTESDQSGAFFGSWVSSTGDVNGDGFGDVIVGANAYSHGEASEGGAFVYLGSGAGLATLPAWSAESDQFVALGGAVASGDLDGDGYGDVIVGFYSYDHPQVDEGRVFAYFGSSTGLATRPGWSRESNQRQSMFGYALSGAGDVNGDGYDDVLVGAYRFDNGQRDEGRAFVYRGTPLRRR